MADEMVFTVTGPTAKPAEPISLNEAGLREREHLQEWVLDHPQILGDDVRIVTFEFGRWAGNDDRIERDRLDILGIDVEGRLVIVELKRDRAPDTVEMQALKYAALASRFTLEELARVHAHYLTRRRGVPVDETQAAAELEEFSDLSEESLRDPRIMLLASSFPRTVTATVVFLHQQLGLDIDLLVFQAYRTADIEGRDEQLLLTVSRLYPPPDVEEFVLSPELSEAKAKKKQRSSRRRDGRTVPKLVAAEEIDEGEIFSFRSPIESIRPKIDAWIAEDPRRGEAAWRNHHREPLVWAADDEAYSPTGLAKRILDGVGEPRRAVAGPSCWVDESGRSLWDIVNTLPPGIEVAIDVHLDALSETLRPVFDALDERLRALGPDVERRVRARDIGYFAKTKITDVQVHGEHLNLYIRTSTMPADPMGLIITDRTPRYVRAKIERLDQIDALMDILRTVYEEKSALT